MNAISDHLSWAEIKSELKQKMQLAIEDCNNSLSHSLQLQTLGVTSNQKILTQSNYKLQQPRTATESNHKPLLLKSNQHVDRV